MVESASADTQHAALPHGTSEQQMSRHQQRSPSPCRELNRSQPALHSRTSPQSTVGYPPTTVGYSSPTPPPWTTLLMLQTPLGHRRSSWNDLQRTSQQVSSRTSLARPLPHAPSPSCSSSVASASVLCPAPLACASDTISSQSILKMMPMSMKHNNKYPNETPMYSP